MEGKNPNITIPEEVESEFQGVVRVAIENNPFVAAKPLKYKVGSRVWVPNLTEGEETVEIAKGSADVYVVRLKNGEYKICDEVDIRIMN